MLALWLVKVIHTALLLSPLPNMDKPHWGQPSLHGQNLLTLRVTNLNFLKPDFQILAF